ncbi:hypothetical protein CSC81_05630 [Tenacibaculum discolor]|uniref:Uncharacterized protein n=1 Tax=Tenacibaculum discolor TaxID=361581 RepID=A0A2G1BV19_9FLAO|nr:hypothetical protein [Tenacibaculum discolor]MDP2539924.1 hypothetical protein [Tenacibaculum discolor]PHN97892.1 hypothetical protein CSC81_05630 [Tenacibaculum discolor]PHO01587.1 hypothetical protein CSC82_22865 [Rhodobacteraceae bacterium 4F10]
MKKEYNYNITSDLREINKDFFDHFLATLEFEDNKFDSSIDSLIYSKEKSIKILNKKLRKHLQQNHQLENFDTETFNFELESFKSENQTVIWYIEEELKALAEMKIVYAFKSIEINIKKLIADSFKIKNKRDFFNWRTVETFLNSKKINLKKVKGHKEIYQLKQLNNSIKHTKKLEEKTLKLIFDEEEYENIPTHPFILEKEITYKHLLGFYNKIKPFIKIFFTDLCDTIYEELYVFNKNKIEDIAENLALRMEKENALELIDKIRQHY